jgi:hypothetical protein
MPIAYREPLPKAPSAPKPTEENPYSSPLKLSLL